MKPRPASAQRHRPAPDSLFVRIDTAQLAPMRAALRRAIPAVRLAIACRTRAGRECGVTLHGASTELARAMDLLMSTLPRAEFGPAHGARSVLIS